MSRYIRVRSTRPQGCHRAGMFHGVEPVVHDTHELTPDQVRLLRAENGRMLLVDDVDGPESANLVPDGDKIGQGERFTSHPQAVVENEALKGKNEQLARDLKAAVEGQDAAEARAISLAGEVAGLQRALAEARSERDAAGGRGGAATGRRHRGRQGG